MNDNLTTRALKLVGFRPEHWHYDYPDCYAKFNDKLKEVAIRQGKPNSIMLAGSLGSGKSAMLAILAKSVYLNRKPWTFILEGNVLPDIFGSKVKYCTHTELSEIWENEFSDRTDLPDENYFKKARILFLDDMFAAPVNISGRNTAKLEDLIDYRWGFGLKTFIATNISLKDLWLKKNSQYHRIARRLSEPNWMHYQELTHKFGAQSGK